MSSTNAYPNDDEFDLVEDAGKLIIPISALLGNDTYSGSGTLQISLPSSQSAALATIELINNTIVYDPGQILQSLKKNDSLQDNFSYTLLVDSVPINNAYVYVTATGINDTPELKNAIPDKRLNVGDTVSYTIPANTFADVDTGDTMTLSVTKADGSKLPSWLRFDPYTNTLSGKVPSSVGNGLQLRVKATDSNGATAQDDFFLLTGSAKVSTGKDLLSDFVLDQSNYEIHAPFFDKIDFTPYLDETWNSVAIAQNVRINSSSAEKSTLSLLSTSTLKNGIENSGIDLTFTGSNSATLKIKYTDKRPPNDLSGRTQSSLGINWDYTGVKSIKSDDLNIAVLVSADDISSQTGSVWAFSGSSIFSAVCNEGSGAHKFTLNGSDTYSSSGDGSNRITDLNTNNFSLTYKDSTGSTPFSFALSASMTVDDVANTMSFVWKNVSAQLGTVMVTTKICSGNDASDLSIGSLLDFDNLTELLQTSWLPLMVQGNNTYTGGVYDDIIDAGAGSDIVIGNKGNDTLEGGTGYDQLTGGIGSDVFIFSAGDSAVSASSADLIKDFKYAEGDQILLNNVLDVPLSVSCKVSRNIASSFDAAKSLASTDFTSGSNVSIQFVGKNAVMFVDTDDDDVADIAVTLVGLKTGVSGFIVYAESEAMFA